MSVQVLNDFNVKRLLEITSEQPFNELAIQIFQFQSKNVAIYKDYLTALGCIPDKVKSLEEIPFLPISFFKTHMVSSGIDRDSLIFESSGTTDSIKSKHFIASPQIYQEVSKCGFELRYGSLTQYSVLGLLPSYLERENSSLVYMVNYFMGLSEHESNGFFLDDFNRLKETLIQNKRSGIPTVLFGVTFALLDFIEEHSIDFDGLIVIETGGMKGRRTEMTRDEIHARLKKGFGVNQIHSEYGMTELLSQAYAKSDGVFIPPPWMKIIIRDIDDPFSIEGLNKTGGLNIIDLANIHSCAFIATDDLGRLITKNSFEVMGRIDNSDIRGCSLMVV